MRVVDQLRVSADELRQVMFTQLLEMGYAFLDAGMVFITAVRGLTEKEANQLRTISQPFDVMIINLEKETPFSDVVCTHYDDMKDDLISNIVNRIQ